MTNISTIVSYTCQREECKKNLVEKQKKKYILIFNFFFKKGLNKIFYFKIIIKI